MRRKVAVFFWKERVLMQGLSGPGGVLFGAGPVLECKPSASEVTAALEAALRESKIPCPVPSDLHTRKLSDVAEYLGLKRESDLTRRVRRSSVDERDGKYEIAAYERRGSGWVSRVSQILPGSTSIEDVARAVLEELGAE